MFEFTQVYSLRGLRNVGKSFHHVMVAATTTSKNGSMQHDNSIFSYIHYIHFNSIFSANKQQNIH